MKKFWWVFLAMLSLDHAVVADNKLAIGEFSQNSLEGWDRLFKTYCHRSQQSQTEMTIGLNRFRDRDELGLSVISDAVSAFTQALNHGLSVSRQCTVDILQSPNPRPSQNPATTCLERSAGLRSAPAVDLYDSESGFSAAFVPSRTQLLSGYQS